jgi:hypothetical protein
MTKAGSNAHIMWMIHLQMISRLPWFDVCYLVPDHQCSAACDTH